MRTLIALLLFPALCHASSILEELPLIPEPELLRSIDIVGGGRELIYSHHTTLEFDTPGYQDKNYEFRISLPPDYSPQKQYNILLWLHGAGMRYDMIPVVPSFGSLLGTYETDECIVIMPSDHEETLWLGYSDALPGDPEEGVVRLFTQRRLLGTLRWALERAVIDGATVTPDLNAIFVAGVSMGGAGSITNGWLLQDLFAGVMAYVPPAGNMESLSGLGDRLLSRKMGSQEANIPVEGTELGAWDYLNVFEMERANASLRDQFLWCHWGRDDTVIPWDMVVRPGRYGEHFLEMMNRIRMGFFGTWDEGGHLYPGQADPWLTAHWWDEGWSPITDDETYLRRNLSFPAFSNSSINDDPGTGVGKVGRVDVARDNTLDGDQVGAINRFLRWRSETIHDTPEEYRIELKVLDGTGRDAYDGPLPVRVDVTPRRLQAFVAQPGTHVLWSTDDGQSGMALVDAYGTFTCEGVELFTRWTALTIVPHRSPRVLLAGYLDGTATLGGEFGAMAIYDGPMGTLSLLGGSNRWPLTSTAPQVAIAEGLQVPPGVGPGLALPQLVAADGQGREGHSWPFLNVGQ